MHEAAPSCVLAAPALLLQLIARSICSQGRSPVRPFPAQVRELERRKAEDAQRREQQAALAAEKARIEAERTAKTK